MEKETRGDTERAGLDFLSHLSCLTMIVPFSSRDVRDMEKALFRFSTPFKRLFGVVVVLGVFLASPDFAAAQSYQDRDSRLQSEDLQQNEEVSPSNLPDWAEPSQPRDPSASSNSKSMAAPPDPPDSPSRIPVDGGLALLAAAGAGYAARKLSKEQEDDDLPA